MLLTAGLVVGTLNGWTLIAVALLMIGLMLMATSLAGGDFNVFSTQFWQKRSTQEGTNAAVAVLSVLLILGLVNFVGARYDHRIDFTDGQLLTLSPATQTVVKELAQPTKVVIFDIGPNPDDQQLLENYKRFNPQFDYQYINPDVQPQIAQQFGVTNFGEVFVQTEASGETEERTLPVQLVNDQERLSERTLTNKLVQIEQTDISVVYFLQGHGEYPIDGSEAGLFEAANSLQDENFTVAPLDLAQTGSIPKDADVIVIAGAREQLFEPEVIALRTYLEQGGSLFILTDPQVETGLEVMMSQWGVVPENTVVIDTSAGGQQVGLGPAAPLVTDYGNHPITEAFGNGRSFFPYARPLQVREVPNIEESPLLFTNQDSHAEPDSLESPGLEANADKPPEGPFTLGVALERPAVVNPDEVPSESLSEAPAESADTAGADADATDAETAELAELEAEIAQEEEASDDLTPANLAPKDSRMVIIGNSTFVTDGLFSQLLNGDIFLNSVGWLSQSERPTLSIRPKEQTNRRLNLTGQQGLVIMLLSLVVFPLFGLVGAGTIWAIRR